MLTRRQFLKISAATGAGLALPWRLSPYAMARVLAQAIPGGSLKPGDVDKYQAPLVKPPAFKRDGRIQARMGKNASYYEIAMREFSQQILPAGMPQTRVWSYGPANDVRTVAEGGAYFYPAFTLEARWQQPNVVKWINGLAGKQHLLPVDPSLHWANPIGRRDTRPNPTDDPNYWDHQYIGDDGRYTGPVPMITHLHGGRTNEESDGYPEAWYLPAGAGGTAYTTGRFYDYFNSQYGLNWEPGTATFEYGNDQRATTLWYHDHTLGMTRLNVYAGPAGFYLLRGGPDDQVLDSRNGRPATLPGPAPGTYPADPFGTYYEIPIVIQDRSFNANGSLYYPDTRAFFEGIDPSELQIPFTFDNGGWGYGCNGLVSDVAPIWQPEFFGNMMVVNGQTWPFLEVEQRRYRFRLLNGSDARFLILDFGNVPGVEVWQIGSDGGFLPAPVRLNDYPYPGSSGGATILMGPAERADVIVDFTDVPVGSYVLTNVGPDEPFGGGDVDDAFDRADPDSTGQVMQFRVVPSRGRDPSTPPQRLVLPAIAALSEDSVAQVSLNEAESENVRVTGDADEPPIVYNCVDGDPFGPVAALLGTVNGEGEGVPKLWADGITENPSLGETQTWEIKNTTVDAHPIHVHLVQFQVLGREPTSPNAPARGPEPWETGWKDTVIAYPGEITRIRAKFDLEGFYVWHCHILEHEDNEMMRPYYVGDTIPANAPAG